MIATTTTTIMPGGMATMLDDFLVRALIAGAGIALITGPLGCFIVWRRMAYFGDTMAHSALLGVALAVFFDINLTLSVFIVATLVSLALLAMEQRRSLPTDALLGILSHSTLALGLVMVAAMTWAQFDLMGLLFGDILAVSVTDIIIIYLGGAIVLAILLLFWRRLLAATVSLELAEAEGMEPGLSRFVFMVLMAAVIAFAMKIVGILLITSLLIIPAATARRFAASPEAMALLAGGIGVVVVGVGLGGSMYLDTPSGPSIVVAAMMGFLVTLIPILNFKKT